MSRLLQVVRREYVGRVRTKGFIISTILGPVFMATLMWVPVLMMSKQRGRALRISVADATGALGPAVEQALERRKTSGQARFAITPTLRGAQEAVLSDLRTRVMAGELDGYVVLGQDALATGKAEYHAKNVSNMMDIGAVNEAVTQSVVSRRLAARGIDPADVQALTRKVDVRTLQLTAAGSREDRGAAFMAAFLLTMMLYSSILLWGAAIMNGVLEEKTNRVVEVIASSIPPRTLFAGKLLGVGAAGLTQFVVWGLSLLAFGAYASASGLEGQLPQLPPLVAVAFVVFFVLGFFLYGSLYAAAGSAVNTMQEAQSLSIPLMLPLPLSLMFAPAVLGSPDSTLAVVLSLIPFFTPLIMLLRVSALAPPWWQLGLSVLLMVSTIVLVNEAAARIYRVGILMYGKRATLPEILRWVRRP